MTHTWELALHYHRCPQCGYIIESQRPYIYRLGKYIVSLECERCHHEFIKEKRTKTRFGPLFNKPTKPEVDWSD